MPDVAVLLYFMKQRLRKRDDMLSNVKIMSYNIHHGADHQERYDLSGCAKVINEAQTDIVAIQEIERFWDRRSNFEDQVVRLADLTSFTHHCFGASLSKLDGGHMAYYGKAVLSRFPIISFKDHALPRKPEYESRSALEVVLKVGRTDLTLFNVHLCLNSENLRAAQLSMILKLAQTHLGPVIILGDFNAVPTEKSLHSMISGSDRVFSDTEWSLYQRHTPTFPAVRPVDKIDYILVNNEMCERLRRWDIIESLVSDHLPVLASFDFF